MNMLEKLEQCFEILQSLDIQPTLANMEKLVQALYNLREVYTTLKEGEDNGGSEIDPDGRNGD